jgi:DNA-binding response OmpR family regulator
LAKILIAEDDPLISSLIEKGLRANGFSTFLADDGEQAQRMGLAEEFDLMILDMGLPGREGLEVLKELRSHGKTLPVLVITGRRERDAAMCLEAGADDYMSKPFRFAELLARVRARLRVKDELDRMGRMVEDLQLLTEAQQPGFLELEQIDLQTFAEELADRASALAPRRWKLDRAAGGTLVADRRRLAVAMMNLAHNAVQHTDENEAVAIGTSLSEAEARLWVKDSGGGISEPDQASIFDRERGLGLAIVRAIAEAHGGRVELESRLGRGSTFTIVLPRNSSERVAGGQNSDR